MRGDGSLRCKAALCGGKPVMKHRGSAAAMDGVESEGLLSDVAFGRRCKRLRRRFTIGLGTGNLQRIISELISTQLPLSQADHLTDLRLQDS